MVTNGADEGPSVFAVYIEELPPPRKAQRPSQAQRMLDWLQRWDKPTIRIRDIRVHGPGRAIRNRESAIRTAEVLVETGWLVPTKGQRQRYNGRTWRIVRRAIVHPTVEMQSSTK
jgi:hypothetical protein